jgi:hypothetical protein
MDASFIELAFQIVIFQLHFIAAARREFDSPGAPGGNRDANAVIKDSHIHVLYFTCTHLEPSEVSYVSSSSGIEHDL